MKNLQEIQIDLRNLQHNIKRLKSLIKPKTCLARLASKRAGRRAKFMAVVKSNAYGHGMVKCAQAAIEAGADWLGVVNINEALELRNAEVKPPILILGYVEAKDFKTAAENDISVAIVNWEQINYLKTQRSKLKAISKNLKLKIHIKIETGISRLGFTEEEWPKLINKLKNLPENITIEGIYSHFASVEEYDLVYAQKQIIQFEKFKKLFESHKPYAISHMPIFHMAASAATMIMPESHFDMVRCGIAIYGLWPSKETKVSFEFKNLAYRQAGEKLKMKNHNLKIKSEFLKPVLSYKTKIVQIKQVERGDFIGYGCTYPVDKSMTIAVIPVGYAEGFDRGFSNPAPVFDSEVAQTRGAGNKSGEVLINGKRCPVVGRVCMNMMVTDVTELKVKSEKLKVGDEVVLIGKQGDEEITADEWAEKLGTINYEITTRLPKDIIRVYNK